MSKALNYSTPTRTEPTPEVNTPQDLNDAAQQFAAGADLHHAPRARQLKPPKAKELEWRHLPHDREVNLVNIRLTDCEKGALDWLDTRMPESKHTIIKRAVIAEVNRLLHENGVAFQISPVEKRMYSR